VQGINIKHVASLCWPYKSSIHVNFFRLSSGRFYSNKREILEFAKTKRRKFWHQIREISFICENTSYSKKNL
jgi:hypothetical protein